MQRVASATDWDEQVDGAWAPGKAPLALLARLLALVQAQETQQAVDTARQILEAEPTNALVRDLLGALQLQEALEGEERSEAGDGADESEDDEEEEDGESGEEEEDSEEDSEVEDSDCSDDDDDGEAKGKGDKETPEEDGRLREDK